MGTKHLFFCGERGVGKSTFIRSLLQGSNPDVGGFLTVCSQREEDQHHLVYLLPARDCLFLPEEEKEKRFLQENLVADCFVDHQKAFPENFDRQGSIYFGERTANGWNKRAVLVMDEIGFLEKDAKIFQDLILHALDGDIPVIGVVKEAGGGSFLQKIRSHPKVELVKVTKENRDRLLQLPQVTEFALRCRL